MTRIRPGVFPVVSILFFTGLGCGPRGPSALPLSGFKVEFGSHNVHKEMVAGKTIVADVTVKNISDRTWPSKPDPRGRRAVNLSYHWLGAKGQMEVFDGLRTSLPHDLGPNESAKLKATIQAPQTPGNYTLEVTLVQETVAWFPQKGGGKISVPVAVVIEKATVAASAGSTTAETTAPAGAGGKKISQAQTSRKSAPSEKSAATPALQKKGGGTQAIAVNRAATELRQKKSSWSVQVGSFREKTLAEHLAKNLSDHGHEVHVHEGIVKGRRWFKVWVGQFDTRGAANKALATLKMKEGLERAFLVNRE